MTPTTRFRRRHLLLLALALAAVASWLASRAERVDVAPPPGETWPDGDWVLAGPTAEPPAEALARQLSLPYAAGTLRADEAGRTGVVAWRPELAQPGWNLYVSGHGHEAILLAMDGAPLHRWRARLAEAFPGVPRSPDGGSFRRAALLADGSLLALVQGMGLVKLDAQSRVVWRHAEPLFNDLWVAPDEGQILVLTKRAIERPDLRRGGPILEDSIVTFDAGGEVVARASLLAAFERSPFRELLFPLGETADILHSNTIEVLDGPGAASAGALARGNLLVSLREIDTVALLDPAGSEVLWARRGPFRRQHEPTLLADGRILLFDNLGGAAGASRVVALDVASGELEVIFAGAPQRPLASPEAGACRRLANGNLLVVASEQGVAWELTPAGEIAWELRTPHRAGTRGQLVASLFDVVRYETRTPFLARFPLPQAP